MTAVEILLAVLFALWLMICAITATMKGRGLGWCVAAALLPPLYLVLLKMKPKKPTSPERARCPLCRMGWVPLDRLPRVCSGCGEEISHAVLQKETHKDMM